MGWTMAGTWSAVVWGKGWKVLSFVFSGLWCVLVSLMVHPSDNPAVRMYVRLYFLIVALFLFFHTFASSLVHPPARTFAEAKSW